MSSPRPRVSDLTPEELELLALEHVESLFIELRAAGRGVPELCHPVKLIQRYPWLAAGLAAAAGALLARRLRPRPAASAQNAASPNFSNSLLSVAAGALPELLALWLTRRNKTD
jgi:hypothetical protein